MTSLQRHVDDAEPAPPLTAPPLTTRPRDMAGRPFDARWARWLASGVERAALERRRWIKATVLLCLAAAALLLWAALVG
jgi:hypothetical protein